jgi:iron complex outermembrane receptor protein
MGLLLGSTALVAGTAQAQQAAAPAGDSVAEVVVTAQRREERLLDVPIAVSVIGGEAAQTAGVVSTRDLSMVTPGLVSGQAGYTFQPSIRGISSTGTSAGDEANVALYVDNVYYAAIGATAFNLANIDRIEVLKGPQGTLFGRNATGGAIRVVTSNPSQDPEFRALLSAGLGGAKSREVSLYGNAPINDQLALGLTGYYYNDDGYLKNADPNFQGAKQGALESYLVRGKLLWTPAENLKIVFEADYGQSISGVELTTTFINNINGFKNVVGVLPALGKREVSTNEQNLDKSVGYGGYLNIQYDTEHYTVTSLTATRTANIRVNLDNDRTNLPLNRNVFRTDTLTFSQELNVASHYDGPFDFIAGLFYFRSDAGNPFFNSYGATISPVRPDGTRVVTAPISLRTSIYDNIEDEAYAAFGEGTYKFNDQFSAVLGLRYNIETKDAITTNRLAPTSPAVSDGGRWTNLSYRATLNYKPNNDTLLYATTSSGFKSGVINASAYTYPNPHDRVRPEKVTAYELGYKSRMFGWLNVAASAFHYDYKDIQLTVNNALSASVGTVGVNILQNAAKAKITGADLELSGRIDEHWSGQVGVSWLPQAKYNDFGGGIFYVPAAGGLGAVATAADLSGTRILRSPKTTFNLGLNYDTDLPVGHLRLSGNYFYSDDFYLVVGQGSRQPAYSLVNFEAAWTDPSERYTVALWGRNLGNEAYFISGLANTGGFSAVWGKPREIGVRLKVGF